MDNTVIGCSAVIIRLPKSLVARSSNREPLLGAIFRMFFFLLKFRHKFCSVLILHIDCNTAREIGILNSRKEKLYRCLNAFSAGLSGFFFIFTFCHLANLNKMLGLTVRCAVRTNYKPLHVELELKATLFYGILLPFSELYIFITC
jgi:hypothetical protein